MEKAEKIDYKKTENHKEKSISKYKPEKKQKENNIDSQNADRFLEESQKKIKDLNEKIDDDIFLPEYIKKSNGYNAIKKMKDSWIINTFINTSSEENIRLKEDITWRDTNLKINISIGIKWKPSLKFFTVLNNKENKENLKEFNKFIVNALFEANDLVFRDFNKGDNENIQIREIHKNNDNADRITIISAMLDEWEYIEDKILSEINWDNSRIVNYLKNNNR